MSAPNNPYLEEFRRTAAERLDRLMLCHRAFQEAAERRQPCDAAMVRTALRELHTLKSEAKMVEYDFISQAAHATEELLLKAQRQEWRLARADADLFLAATDVMAALLELPVGPEAARLVELPEFLARIDACSRDGAAPPASAPDQAVAAALPAEGSASGAAVLAAATRDAARLDMARLDQLTGAVGDFLAAQQRLAGRVGSLEQHVEQLRRGLEGLHHTMPRQHRAVARQKGMLDALQITLARVLGEVGASRLAMSHIEASARQLRLVALSTLLKQLPRAVRRLAKELGKEVSVVVQGGEAEVDSHILADMGEPLLHLVRNAVAHGVESPLERERLGKPRAGEIAVVAVQQGGFVEISVSDDGAGLDAARVREAAIRLNVATAEQMEDWSPQQVLSLVLRPGFTTREHTDQVSGRGIGLDVVKERVEALGGSITVRTQVGVGSQFVLRLPVSLVLCHVVVVQVGGVTLAVPAESVERLVRLDAAQCAAVSQGAALELDQGLLKVVPLQQALGVPARAGEPQPPEAVVLVTSHGDQRAGLLVDRVVGQRQVLKRPLEKLWRGLRAFSGTAQLEGGEPVGVLQVGEMLAWGGQVGPAIEPLAAAPSPGARRTVLVVDDSEFIRDVVVAILRRHGDRVIEAMDGRDALQKLAREVPDVILSDLEMPVMDGFALLEKVQENPAWQNLPVVVFSTRGSSDDRQRAAALGADAYLVKSGFKEADLLALLERYAPLNTPTEPVPTAAPRKESDVARPGGG